MPIITMTMGPATQDQKTRLVADLTASAAAATQIPEQFFTVAIQELPLDSLGVGGKTVAAMHADES